MNAGDWADIRAIEELKYRYVRALDGKDWDLFADTLCPDVTADFGAALSFTGADTVVAFLQDALTDQVITVHQVHHPEIEVDGARATAHWRLTDRVLHKRNRILLDGAAEYHDRLRRGPDGRWRIAHTGYHRYYESMVDLADLPSFQLTADRFGPAPGTP